MLDSDLAEMYGIETKTLNRAVMRNIERFPERFMFQLSKKEYEILRCQFGTSKGGRRYLPYVFTEQGVAMLSGVLKSETAIKVSLQIIDAFVSMRKFIVSNAQIFYRLDSIEQKQIVYDQKFGQIFDALQDKIPEKGIFFDGSVFDAYKFVSDLIRSATKSIILIDNYVDDSILLCNTLLSHPRNFLNHLLPAVFDLLPYQCRLCSRIFLQASRTTPILCFVSGFRFPNSTKK